MLKRTFVSRFFVKEKISLMLAHCKTRLGLRGLYIIFVIA